MIVVWEKEERGESGSLPILQYILQCSSWSTQVVRHRPANKSPGGPNSPAEYQNPNPQIPRGPLRPETLVPQDAGTPRSSLPSTPVSNMLRIPLPCYRHQTASLPRPPVFQAPRASSSHRIKPCAHLLNPECLLTPVETSRLSQSGVMASGPQAGADPGPRAATTVAAIFLLRRCHKATVVKRSVTLFSPAVKPPAGEAKSRLTEEGKERRREGFFFATVSA